MKGLSKLIVSGSPFLIISGLLYAGLYVKPAPLGKYIPPPIIERGDHFFGLASGGDQQIWAVGSDGKILNSRDGASSWQVQGSGTRSALQDVAAWDQMHAISVGNGSTIVRTEDGGNSWGKVSITNEQLPAKLIRVKALPRGKAWIVGESGTVLRTDDFGKSWSYVGTNEDVAWNDLSIIEDRIIIVGEFGRAKLSTDDGKSWNEIKTPVKASLMSIAFRDSKNGIAVGLGGIVIATNDGGKSWVAENSPTAEHLFNVLWDGARWVSIGDKGVVCVKKPNEPHWKTGLISSVDRSWYTAIASVGERYLVAGAQIRLVDKRTW